MDHSVGAIVIGVTGESPRIRSIVTNIGMSGGAQIEKVTEVFAVDTGHCSSGRVCNAVIGDVIRCNVDSSWSDDQGRPGNSVVNGAVCTIVIRVTGKAPGVRSIITDVSMGGAT